MSAPKTARKVNNFMTLSSQPLARVSSFYNICYRKYVK